MVDETIEEVAQDAQATDQQQPVNPTGDYGIPNEHNIYVMGADWMRCIQHISTLGIGPHHLIHVGGRHLLSCNDDIPVDGVNILEKIR
jgi:hypothetical protein